MKLDLKALFENEGDSPLKGLPLGLVVSVIVLAANLLFWALAMPEIEAGTQAMQLRQGQIGGEIAGLDKKISEMKAKLAEIPQLEARYKAEEEKGVFGPENRLNANSILADVKARHFEPKHLEELGVYRLEMLPGELTSFSAGGAQQSWFASSVRISIEMAHDRYVYPFVYEALNSLNGVSVLNSLLIERRRTKEFVEAFKANAKDLKVTMPLIVDLQFTWLTSEPPSNSDASVSSNKGRP